MLNKLIKATKLLYPTGRAFRLYANNNLGRLHKALAQSEKRFYDAAQSMRDSLLPDNFNFTTNDAQDWERRLGMQIKPNVTLTQRKLAIQRKYNHPGDIKARQSIPFFQSELQSAGFSNLVVQKNKVNGQAVLHDEYFGLKHQTALEHGEEQHGQAIPDVVINSLEGAKDEAQFLQYLDNVPSGTNLEPFYRFSFLVSGENTTIATIDKARRKELRKLILSLKPASMFCLLYVNYQ